MEIAADANMAQSITPPLLLRIVVPICRVDATLTAYRVSTLESGNVESLIFKPKTTF
jgi:hypothetical protein